MTRAEEPERRRVDVDALVESRDIAVAHEDRAGPEAVLDREAGCALATGLRDRHQAQLRAGAFHAFHRDDASRALAQRVLEESDVARIVTLEPRLPAAAATLAQRRAQEASVAARVCSET